MSSRRPSRSRSRSPGPAAAVPPSEKTDTVPKSPAGRPLTQRQLSLQKERERKLKKGEPVAEEVQIPGSLIGPADVSSVHDVRAFLHKTTTARLKDCLEALEKGILFASIAPRNGTGKNEPLFASLKEFHEYVVKKSGTSRSKRFIEEVLVECIAHLELTAHKAGLNPQHYFPAPLRALLELDEPSDPQTPPVAVATPQIQPTNAPNALTLAQRLQGAIAPAQKLVRNVSRVWIALGLTGESTLDKFMENNKGLKVLHMTRLIHFLVGADDQIPEHKVGIVQLLDETMRKALEEAMAALEPLSEAELVALIDGATALCAAEPRLLLLKGKLAAVGDLHECVASQFAALLAAKELHRVLTGNQFERVVLFLGDYADRGGYKHLGLNVLAINCALKVLNPEKVFLLRGNHESRDVAGFYGLETALATLGFPVYSNVYNALMRFFASLPLCAKVRDKYDGVPGIDTEAEEESEPGLFFSHAGIPRTPKLDAAAINAIPQREVIACVGPDAALIGNFSWSDPLYDDAKTSKRCGRITNPGRTAYVYDWCAKDSAKFLEANNVRMIIRAHQCFPEGFKWHHGNRVLTLFTCASYTYGTAGANSGAIAFFNGTGKEPRFYTFDIPWDLCKALQPDPPQFTNKSI